MRRATLFVVAALGLVVAAQAGAHAEIVPETVPAGAVSKFVLSVEGEEDALTTKVAMQLPAGVTNAKPSPGSSPGWQANRGGRVITWTGGRLQQGERVKFEVSAHFPNSPGRTLVFPVVQTYANGTIVRWIGAPASDTPAPRIRLTAAAQPPPPPPPQATTPTTTTSAAGESDDDDSGAAGWIIGVVVVLGLLAVGGVLLWRRRR